MDIDEKTKISLFAIIGITPFIVGGILWLANIDAKATAASVESQTVKEIILDIRERIVRIENRLNSRR